MSVLFSWFTYFIQFLHDCIVSRFTHFIHFLHVRVVFQVFTCSCCFSGLHISYVFNIFLLFSMFIHLIHFLHVRVVFQVYIFYTFSTFYWYACTYLCSCCFQVYIFYTFSTCPCCFPGSGSGAPMISALCLFVTAFIDMCL